MRTFPTGQTKPRARNDNVPKSYSIIYENNNRWYLVLGYMGIGITLVPTMMAAVTQFTKSDEEIWNYYQYGVAIGTQSSRGSAEEMRAFICLGAALNLLLFLGARKLFKSAFFRVYMNEAAPNKVKFIAVKRDMFLRRQNVEFTRDDVRTRQLRPGLLSFLEGNIVIHGQTYFMAYKDFISSAAYNKMAGQKKVHL